MEAYRELTDSMGALFYFFLKKTGDSYEAENLTQEVLVSALTSLRRGEVREFRPWLWRIARNRYADWARRKHAKLESECELCVDFEPASDDNPESALVAGDELARMRRELAFISREYRELIVGYYIENLGIKQLADRFSLHPEAVKSRLFRARKSLKEGMNMAREFGIRSYNPEEISFVNNGICGEQGQPWNVLTHSMYKNIFLEVYGNPESAEELAIELGIALPYMEDELEFLTRETLLKKENGRYETTFAIISREVQRKIHDESLAAASKLAELLCTYVDRVFGENPELYGGNVRYADAKWALLMHTADIAYRSSRKASTYEYTKRPNNGTWDIIGYQSTDFAEPPFVGQHGCFDRSGRKCVNFSQFKFKYKDICCRSTDHLDYEEGEALKAIALGSECDPYYAQKLIDYGYVSRDGDKLKATVCVIGNLPDAPELAEASELLAKSNERFSELIRAELPTLIKNDPTQCALACSATVERGYICDEAVKRGWLVYDESSAKSLGAMLVLP